MTPHTDLSLRRASAAFALALSLTSPPAAAGIIVETYAGGTPNDPLGGFAMTEFPLDGRPLDSLVTSVDSPIEGTVLFRRQGGVTDLPLRVETVASWEADHGGTNLWHNAFDGSVYVAPLSSVTWMELLMPANTHAFSLFVGATFSGSGWVEGYDDLGNLVHQPFTVGPNQTPGFGFYTTDACSTISKVIVEPREWAVGQFAIHQSPCGGRQNVPEPSSLALMLFGIAGVLGAGARARAAEGPIAST